MLTKRQKQILDFIAASTKKHGFAPTHEEIKKWLKLRSVSNIHQHIQTLEAKGYLQKQKNQRRSIEVAGTESLVKIPLLGTIAAGRPIEAIENPGETIFIAKSEVNDYRNYYALRVQGDSMINEGIFDGDIVVIRKQKTADDGQTVVAIIDDNEATLKKIYREKKRIRLQPANQAMLPIYRKEVEVRGVVVKIIRNLETSRQISSKIVKWKYAQHNYKNITR